MTNTFLALALWGTLADSAGAAQPDADPCTTKTITCPTPMSNNSFVHINLEPDSSSVCRFDPRLIDTLDINVGESVNWSFCNACSKDMEVEFSTLGTGPFNNFRIFLPSPTADNLVTIPVGCKSYGGATGMGAVNEGDWKYTLRARVKGVLAFHDEIDPRLEIDDRTFMLWVVRSALVLFGAGLGFAGARFLTQRAKQA